MCSHMLTYAHVCSRMFTYAHVCSRAYEAQDVFLLGLFLFEAFSGAPLSDSWECGAEVSKLGTSPEQ